MASAFPPPPAGDAGAREIRVARPPRRESGGGPASLAEIMADVTSQSASGACGPAPRGPASHFFPSVPRAQREQARKARLASTSPDPITASKHAPAAAPTFPGKARGIQALLSAAGEEGHSAADDSDLRRERQAKLELASSGPFDNRRPSVAIEPVDARRGVGAGGSGGTKRRFRDAERTAWDAASDLVMFEREREKALKGWTGAGADDQAAMPGTAGERGKGRDAAPSVTPDGEKTPTQSMRQRFAPVDATEDVAMAVDDELSPSASPEAEARSSEAPSFASADDHDDGDVLDDDASIMTGMTGATGLSVEGEGEDGTGKEPAKKRSRTLTTPAQTAVLNALLAKTRFPSTETREEVGRQIGMSARRVQIWFQNRRQSQKRQRDREAQEAAAASAAAAAAMAAGHHPGYASHPQMAYPPDGYNQAAHFYPPLQPKPHPQSMNGGYPLHPDMPRHPSMESLGSRAGYASSQHSLHSMHSRDGLPQLPSDARYASPYGNGAVAAYAAYGQQQQQHAPYPQQGYPPHLQQPPQQQRQPFIPSKLYFPHVSRSHAPPGRLVGDTYHSMPTSPTAVSHGVGPDVKLPSLSSVLHGSVPPAQQPAQVHAPISAPVQHQPMFSHSPFSPPPPAHTTVPPTSAPLLPQAPTAQAPPSYSRSLFSPEPSSSFERLRISGGPLSPPPAASSAPFASSTPFSPPTVTATAAPTPGGPHDVLDAAMEAIAYRSHGRALPARQSLPPLRAVFGDPLVNAGRAKKSGHSEADKALLAPIGAGAGGNGLTLAGPPRLAPIQSFAPLVASTPVSPRSHAAALPSSSALSPHETPHGTANGLGDSRASTWSDVSHATRSSAASFEFGAPPPGSYRESASERSVALGGGVGAGRPLPALPVEEDAERGKERVERGGSVGTEETSAGTSVSSEGGVKA